ncbi:hypothetical protein FHX76_000412 [Lysinibacter cavernae]|uniref:Uncharacterized protein n=1 Tax=Lysinibacter cavernae TaxID=1640652 RepID=A0A7X5QYV6_9MICO|nr:hypothetical protein [Lysinibacter cavernae]
MIDHNSIGNDEDLAREVLVIGRSIAPCLTSFTDESEEQKNALAILRRVYKEVAGRGSRFVKAQRIGSASVDYGSVSSAFDGDPRRALEALCASAGRAGAPAGRFPAEATVSKIWPEGRYT